MGKKLNLIFGLIMFFPLVALGENKLYRVRIVKKVSIEQKASGKVIYYKVKKGDRLLKILKEFGIPPKKLSLVAEMNKIKNPNVIYPGQKIKLPLGRNLVHGRFKLQKEERFSAVLKELGVLVEGSGFILLNSGVVDFSKTPKIIQDNESFILDLNNQLTEDQIGELKSIGIGVLKGKKEFRELFEKQLISSFGSYDTNGTLSFGNRDRLVYRYDYSVFDESTGKLKIFNLSADTPYYLRRLMRAYGVDVYQPEVSDERGQFGKLKILSGNYLEKLAGLVTLVTGFVGKFGEGISFEKMSLFIAKPNSDPERISLYRMKGFRTVILSNDFLNDVVKVLNSLAVPSERVKLVVVEPPGTSGKRSKFIINGLMVHARDRDWFMIDGVEKVDEIPYLRSRGVNLIIY